ncbi:MAG: copper resistance protein CopC [Alphaproteobacteria bacterium]
MRFDRRLPNADQRKRRRSRRLIDFVLAAALSAIAGAALASSQLVSSTPAGGQTVSTPARLELHFVQPLDPATSRVHLDMTKLRIASGLVRHMRKVDIKVQIDPADTRTMIVLPVTPLPSGVYRVGWRTASPDGHRQSSSYSFTVR